MDFDEIPMPAEEAPIAPPVHQELALLPDPEPEDALSEFNRKFQQTIDDRRANETDVERAHRAKATEDLQQWQLQRQTRLGAKKEKNRSEEQVLLESIESEVEASNSWDRVTKLVDLATEPSTDNKKADTTRMKKLLIQLKNEPLPAKNN